MDSQLELIGNDDSSNSKTENSNVKTGGRKDILEYASAYIDAVNQIFNPDLV